VWKLKLWSFGNVINTTQQTQNNEICFKLADLIHILFMLQTTECDQNLRTQMKDIDRGFVRRVGRAQGAFLHSCSKLNVWEGRKYQLCRSFSGNKSRGQSLSPWKENEGKKRGKKGDARQELSLQRQKTSFEVWNQLEPECHCWVLCSYRRTLVACCQPCSQPSCAWKPFFDEVLGAPC